MDTSHLSHLWAHLRPPSGPVGQQVKLVIHPMSGQPLNLTLQWDGDKYTPIDTHPHNGVSS